MPYQLNLLGPFTILAPSAATPVGKLNRKTRAILAYLAATAGQHHSRRALSEWFCQDSNDPAGTLRWHLSQIRRKVSPELLEVTRYTAAINTGAIQCDHHQFQAVIDDLAGSSTEALAEAIALYRGPFLADLSVKNAPEFELWLLGERSRWQRFYEKGAAALIVRRIQQSQNAAAIPVAQNLLQSNPFLESIHAYLIWLYAQTGQREAALKQFAQCRTLLWEELAVAPMVELQDIHAAIEQNLPLPPILPDVEPSLSAAAAASADFIGRSHELGQLQALLQNEGAVALVDGPAGSGKTRLLQELSRRFPATPRFTGGCYESTRPIPYHPWLAILEQRLEGLGADLLAQLTPYWRQQLSLLLPELAETAVAPNQQQLFRAIVHLLTELDTSPCLLILDDLQWADEASLQLFQFVAQQLERATRPILLVATYRTEEAVENPALLTLLPDLERLPHFTRLTLQPFTGQETERLIAALWQDLPEGFRSPHMRDMLLQATGGNPLYMTEILQELTLVESLPADLPMPPSLAALVGRRLQQLPANGRQVIESLAILDQPAHFDLAQQISARSEEETLAAIEKGLHWRLLQTHEEFQIDFSHDLMRTAVLQQISPIRQQRLHRRAAIALTQNQAEAATLAYHWGLAGNRERESHFAVLAARKATGQYAVDDAIRFYRRAIPHLPDAATKLEAMRQLSRLYQRISDWDNARQVISAGLAEAPPETAAAAQFQIQMGQLLSRQSHYERALRILQDAYQTCQTIEAMDLLAHCVGTMGIIHFFRDAYEQSLACYEEALAVAQDRQDEENSAVWLGNIAAIYLQKGEHARALPHVQQAVAVHKRLGNQEQLAVSLGNLGDIYRGLGQYQRAVIYHTEALQIRYEWGDRAGAATNLRHLGIDYAEVGLTKEAMTCFWQALTLDIELARRDACGVVLGYIGDTLARQGERTAALEALATAVSLLRLTHSRYYLCRFLLDEIELLWPQARWPEIETLLDEATTLARDIGQEELLFAARLLAVRLQVARGEVFLAQAIAALAALPDDEVQTAAAGYAIWRLDPEQEQWRQETAVRYRRLHEQMPQAEYRRRYAALTGHELPVSLTLPDPPNLVKPLATTLSPYLTQLKRFLETDR